MISEEVIPLSQHDILSQSECEALLNLVMGLEHQWTYRANGFFTLGLASYLDAPQRFGDLVELRKSNALLLGSFDQLLERVRVFFEQLLGEPVSLASDCTLPGFHIFRFQGEDHSNDDVALRAHFDLQWMKAMPNLSPSSTLSFTLPIAQPSGGASMAIWPARYHAYCQHGLSIVEYAKSCPSQVITYVPGRIVVHDGLILHAIGSASIARPKGWRVTLQGHGVRTAHGWTLYW
jgi:hypothetical protein